jgi:hypothetical protein
MSDVSKLPIKQVKVYQSVSFEGAQNSYFTPSAYMSVNTAKPKIVIERMPHGGITVRSDKCLIEIGLANIAFIEYDLSAEKLSEDDKIVSELKAKKGK